jgi:small multidrug resistance pump
MHPILILLAGGLTLTIGDLIAGKWISNKNKLTYILAITFYMIGLIFLIETYKYKDIPVASITMEIFNVIILTLAGIFLFKEKITKTELAGIVIGMIAVVILEFA